MTFGSPIWFWALLLAPILLVLFLRNERRSATLVQRVVAQRLVPQLAGNVSYGLRRLRFTLLLLGLVCLVVALAKPRLGYTFEEARRRGHDVIVAIDTSRSMLANDLPPNRLTRAKMAARDLIEQLQGDRVGLVAFAGNAFLQAPLTVDYGAVLNTLQELDTDIIPRGGTNISQALKTAIEAFGKGESESRAIVLFTDGEELDENAVDLAEKYADQIIIFTVGVGSEEGAIIPVPKMGGGTAFVRDNAGEVVRTQLDSVRLEEIADVTGGFYQRLTNAPVNMRRIVTSGLAEMTEQQIDARMARRPIERYQWPLGLGLLLLAATVFIPDRRRRRGNSAAPLGQTAVVLAAMALSLPMAHAANEGVALYHDKNYEEAYQRFRSQLERQPSNPKLHFDVGTAAYQLGKYDEALQSFSEALTSKDPAIREDAEYNLGNTLFQRGEKQEEPDAKIREWKSAIEHYDQALAVNAGNADAQFNRDVVQKLIEQLEQQQEQQKQDQENKDDENKEEEKEDEKKDSQQQQQKGDDEEKQDQSDDQQKQDQSDDQQKQDQSGDEQKEGQDGEQKPEDSKSDDSKSDEKSDGEKQDEQQAENDQEKSQDGESGKNEPRDDGEPLPAPSPSDRDLSGEMQANEDESQGAEQPQDGEAPMPVEDGKMNAQQAAALLRSLQDEDAQIPLRQRRRAGPVLKDW